MGRICLQSPDQLLSKVEFIPYPFIIIILLHVYGCLPAHVYFSVPLACLLPAETRRGHCVPWNWNHRWLWVAMWALGIKPVSSRRATSPLNRQVVSPAHITLLLPFLDGLLRRAKLQVYGRKVLILAWQWLLDHIVLWLVYLFILPVCFEFPWRCHKAQAVLSMINSWGWPWGPDPTPASPKCWECPDICYYTRMPSSSSFFLN